MGCFDRASYQQALSETHFRDSQRATTLNRWNRSIRRISLGRAVTLRRDFDGAALRRLAKVSKDGGQSRRLVALAEIYDGARRTEAAHAYNAVLTVECRVIHDGMVSVAGNLYSVPDTARKRVLGQPDF